MSLDDSGIQKIIKYELQKSVIPINIFNNKKCVKLMESFIVWHDKFVKNILQSTLQIDYISTVRKEFKKKLNNFISFDIPILKLNRNYLLNYIITFMKLVEHGEFRTTDTEIVNKDSIENALSDFSEFDYYILLTCQIPFSKIWIFLSDNRDITVKCIDQMYKISKMIYDSHVKRMNYDILFNDQKIPCIIYDTKLHGKSNIIKTIITESISKNEAINDPEYRQEVINTSNKVVNSIINTMVKSGIKDDTDLDVSESGISPNIINTITSANKTLQEDLKNGKIDVNSLTDVGVSLIIAYKENPEAVKAMPQFQQICCYVVEAIEQIKKSGQKLPPTAEKIYRVLKGTFYDSSVRIDASVRRELEQQRRMFAKNTKIKYKVKRK